MGEMTRIEWTDHTFNPWIGCTKISEACHSCYAEKINKRTGNNNWGQGKSRRRTSDAYWDEPLRWDRKARKAGVFRRVFCASMADVFDPEAPEECRPDLWHLIQETTNLLWLLLTKRPENIRQMLRKDLWGDPRIWLGVTAENQKMADQRIPILLQTPAAKRFVSVEPMLGPVVLEATGRHLLGPASQQRGMNDGLDWVICGPENGPGARPMDLEWPRSLLAQCRAAGVPIFMKTPKKYALPSDLMVKEFPA